MPYRIAFTSAAREQATNVARHIAEQSTPDAASRWLDGLVEAITSLRSHPHRCALARENEHFEGPELRQLLFKSHRVIYTVREEEVVILHVRHGRQDTLDQV